MHTHTKGILILLLCETYFVGYIGANDLHSSLLSSKKASNFDWNVNENNVSSGPCTLLWALNGSVVYSLDDSVDFGIALSCVNLEVYYSVMLASYYFTIPLPEYYPVPGVIFKYNITLTGKEAFNISKLSLKLVEFPKNMDHIPAESHFIIAIKIIRLSELFPTTYLPNQLKISSLHTLMLFRTREYFGELLNTLNLTGVGVELGARTCSFAEHMLRKWKGKYYIMIDPWDYNPYSSTGITAVESQKHENDYEECRNRISKFDDRGILLRISNYNYASKLISMLSLDFVYLHSQRLYFDVMSDLTSWWPKVKVGGILAGYSIVLPGVEEALIEFSIQMNAIIYKTGGSDPSWYLIK